MAEGVGGRRSMKEFSGRGRAGLKCCLCEEEEMLEMFREAEPSRGEDPRIMELLVISGESNNLDAVESAKASLFSEKGVHHE
jgi:hypothetical protein